MEIDLRFIKNDYFLKTLEEYLTKLFQTNKKIVGILLFGSLARNEATNSQDKVSDIDLLVVFEEGELPSHPIKRPSLEILLLKLAASGIDSIWMTVVEFKAKVGVKMDVLLSALYEGIILYDPFSLIITEKEKLFKELKEKGVLKRIDYWIWPLKYLGEEIEW